MHMHAANTSTHTLHIARTIKYAYAHDPCRSLTLDSFHQSNYTQHSQSPVLASAAPHNMYSPPSPQHTMGFPPTQGPPMPAPPPPPPPHTYAPPPPNTYAPSPHGSMSSAPTASASQNSLYHHHLMHSPTAHRPPLPFPSLPPPPKDFN